MSRYPTEHPAQGCAPGERGTLGLEQRAFHLGSQADSLASADKCSGVIHSAGRVLGFEPGTSCLPPHAEEPVPRPEERCFLGVSGGGGGALVVAVTWVEIMQE